MDMEDQRTHPARKHIKKWRSEKGGKRIRETRYNTSLAPRPGSGPWYSWSAVGSRRCPVSWPRPPGRGPEPRCRRPDPCCRSRRCSEPPDPGFHPSDPHLILRVAASCQSHPSTECSRATSLPVQRVSRCRTHRRVVYVRARVASRVSPWGPLYLFIFFLFISATSWHPDVTDRRSAHSCRTTRT